MSKIQVKHILYFLTTVTLCLVLTQKIFIYVMKSVKVDTVGKINMVMSHQLKSELTIWGASTALLNINPTLISDSLNITAFNMGIDGTNIDQYNGLIREYIKSSKEGQYVIITLDIYSGLEKRDQLYELHNWIHHIDNDNIYNCFKDIDNDIVFKARYVPFYSITLFDKHAFPYFIKTIKIPSDNYIFSDLGFKPEDIIMEKTSIDTKTHFNLNYNMQVYQKLKSTCIFAIENKIKPIIVVTPCFYKGLEEIENKDEFKTLIHSLKNDGIMIFDFLETAISYDVTNFKDNTHLNSKGADKLTNMLIQKLKQSTL